jgi:hypothetical protein
MADIKGYVNPRSFGNTEPNEFLHMDIFFEQELWDRYIATDPAHNLRDNLRLISV